MPFSVLRHVSVAGAEVDAASGGEGDLISPSFGAGGVGTLMSKKPRLVLESSPESGLVLESSPES